MLSLMAQVLITVLTMPAIHRLTEAQIKTAQPIEAIVPGVSARVLQAVKKHPGFSRAEPLVRGAVEAIRDGKSAIVKRRTRWLCDGGGLWVAIHPSPHDHNACSKNYVFRYSLPEKVTSRNGKVRQRQRQHGIGSSNTLTLDEAREKARECRKLLLDKIDPITVKRGKALEGLKLAENKLRTWDAVTDEFLRNRGELERWSATHARNWVQSMRDHISPILGNIPVSAIDTALAIKALADLWSKHPVTASRVRGRCEDVFSYGILQGYAQDSNPFRFRGHLQHRFKPRTEVEHLPALPYAEMPAFWNKLVKIEDVASLSLQWTILNCARTSETLQALASEIDWERRLWLVPRSHKKQRRHMEDDYFMVPLTDAAMLILQKLGKREPNERLFPIHASKMLWAVKNIGQAVTVHGFRATFKTWSREASDTDSEVVKACMSHKVGSRVDLAYHRGPQFVEKKRRHLQIWSDYVTGSPQERSSVFWK